MVRRAFICKDDLTSHDGWVTEGQPTFTVMGKWVARVGHNTYCPKCKGYFPIIKGLPGHTLYGQDMAVHGMKTACGATLIASQFTDTIEVGDGPVAAVNPRRFTKPPTAKKSQPPAVKPADSWHCGVPEGQTHFDNSDLATLYPCNYVKATPSGALPSAAAAANDGNGESNPATSIKQLNAMVDEEAKIMRANVTATDKEGLRTQVNALRDIGGLANKLDGMGVDRNITLNRAGYTRQTWSEAFDKLTYQHQLLLDAEDEPKR